MARISKESRTPRRRSSGIVLHRAFKEEPVASLPEIVVIAGSRTPMAEWIGGKRGDGLPGGALASVSAIDLGAIAAARGAERAGVSPDRIDHVIMGNAMQTSADAIYGARHGTQGRHSARRAGAHREPALRFGPRAWCRRCSRSRPASRPGCWRAAWRT
jgi:hypothetical protein